MGRTRDFAEVIKKKLSANKPLADEVSEIAFHASVAEQIYNVRVEAGLTQAALGTLIGSTQSVIARLEDSDYEGHSLSMLLRICKALGKELHVVIKDRPYANAGPLPAANAPAAATQASNKGKAPRKARHRT